jgi:hypothetical protein
MGERLSLKAGGVELQGRVDAAAGGWVAEARVDPAGWVAIGTYVCASSARLAIRLLADRIDRWNRGHARPPLFATLLEIEGVDGLQVAAAAREEL